MRYLVFAILVLARSAQAAPAREITRPSRSTDRSRPGPKRAAGSRTLRQLKPIGKQLAALASTRDARTHGGGAERLASADAAPTLDLKGSFADRFEEPNPAREAAKSARAELKRGDFESAAIRIANAAPPQTLKDRFALFRAKSKLLRTAIRVSDRAVVLGNLEHSAEALAAIDRLREANRLGAFGRARAAYADIKAGQYVLYEQMKWSQKGDLESARRTLDFLRERAAARPSSATTRRLRAGARAVIATSERSATLCGRAGDINGVEAAERLAADAAAQSGHHDPRAFERAWVTSYEAMARESEKLGEVGAFAHNFVNVLLQHGLGRLSEARYQAALKVSARAAIGFADRAVELGDADTLGMAREIAETAGQHGADYQPEEFDRRSVEIADRLLQRGGDQDLQAAAFLIASVEQRGRVADSQQVRVAKALGRSRMDEAALALDEAAE
jgi:hypothetical protein